MEATTKICDLFVSKREREIHKYSREQPNWWSDEIAELRREVIKHRRRCTRARRKKTNGPEREAQLKLLKENLHAARKTLKTAIKKAKQAVEQPIRIDANNEIVSPLDTFSLSEIQAIVDEWCKPSLSSLTEKMTHNALLSCESITKALEPKD